MPKLLKRKEIVRASLEIIAEQGFHGATMATIAGRAGVAAGTIYLYFPSKDVLITEIYREVKEKVTAYIEDGYSPEKSLRERFFHLGMALMRYFIKNPVDFRYIEQYYNSPYGVAIRRDQTICGKEDRSVLCDLLRDGVAEQVIKDLPMAILFALAFGPFHAVARDHILNFISLDDSLITRIVEATWDCIS